MRIGNKSYIVDWQHLIFLAVVGIGILLYLLEARAVSTATNNLLLVQPLSIFAFLLCLFIVPQCFRPADALIEDDRPDDMMQPELPKDPKELIPVGYLAAALGIMVLTLNTVGFDIGIWAFATAAMLICGERRPVMLLLYPAAITIVAVYGFRALMPYPMVTTIL